MKKVTAANYTKDQLYPVVARAMAEILKRKDFVAPVNVLLQPQRITKQQSEDWHFGRIAYRERVTVGGLGKMSRILRIIELHARTLNLTPSPSVYRKWGKGGKRIVLRFSKSGDHNLEAAYSRHYVATGRLQVDQRIEARSVDLVPPFPAGHLYIAAVHSRVPGLDVEKLRRNLTGAEPLMALCASPRSETPFAIFTAGSHRTRVSPRGWEAAAFVSSTATRSRTLA